MECLTDSVASEFAIYAPAFRPLVEHIAKQNKLGFNVIEVIRAQCEPTASLLSTDKAVVKYWLRPAATLTAEFRGRLNEPDIDEALRITPQGYNKIAGVAGLTFFPNVRVPVGIPIHLAFQTGVGQNDYGHLGDGDTSQDKRLTPLDMYTSAPSLKIAFTPSRKSDANHIPANLTKVSR